MAGNCKGSSLDEAHKVVPGQGTQRKEAGHIVRLVGEGGDVDGVVPVYGVPGHSAQLVAL